MSGFFADLNKAQRALLAPLLLPAKAGERPRTASLRGVLDAVFYLRNADRDCRDRLHAQPHRTQRATSPTPFKLQQFGSPMSSQYALTRSATSNTDLARWDATVVVGLF